MNVTFFQTAADFRAWLEANHDTAAELIIGFYKKGANKTGMTYAEAVEQALCFGWIDGVRYKHDAESYLNRFTPRTPRSHWSQVNIGHVERLKAAGLMHPAGLKAYEGRDRRSEKQYSSEQDSIALPDEYAAKLRDNPAAWDYFQSAPPSYRKQAIWWVISAKQEATRQRRLTTLIDDSAAGLRVKPLRRKPAADG